MRKIVCILSGLLLLALLPEMVIASNARVYRRVNASGAIRYSNIPPPTRSFASYRVKVVPAPSRLRPMIRSASHRYGVDPRLVEAIIAVESAFDPGAVSPKGAMGLMQLMPETADRYAVQNPFDPRQNISGGIRYLRYLLSRFHGNLRLALAAYNAGETAVNMYQGVPPYRETRTYVKRVLRRYGWPTALITRRASPVRVYRFPGSRGQIIYTNIPARIPLR